MPDTVHASAEALIAAPVERVIDFLADYRDRRPEILPANYQDYAVEEGGRGAGTVYRFRLKVGPRERGYRMRVEEVTGESIRERDLESSLSTVWSLARGTADATQVRIETSWQGAGGVGGFFERTFAPRGLGRVHSEMLGRLADALART